MKKIFIILLILAPAICFGQDKNKNSELIREIIQNKNYDGFGRYEARSIYGETHYPLDYKAIGLLYVAGCHPEYLEKYGKGYIYKERVTTYGDYVVTGGSFGTPVHFGRAAKSYNKEKSLDLAYDVALSDIGIELEKLCSLENKELNESQIKEIKIAYLNININIRKIRKIGNKAYKEKLTNVEHLF